MNPLSRLLTLLSPSPPDPDTQAAILRIVERVGKAIALTPGFEAKLTKPVQLAREYCATLVDSMPPATNIARQYFASDPLVHALFATADDIGAMAAASPSIRQWLLQLQSRINNDFYALMAARRMEKKVLGTAMHGDVVTSDEPQTLLQFSTQMLLMPAPTQAGLRAQLIDGAFDSLLLTFTDHIENARATYKSLQTDRELERARLRIVDQQAPFPSRHLTSLDENLHRQFQSLQPDALIEGLANFLARPEEALNLTTVRLWVKRNGVLQSVNSHDEDAVELCLHELVSRDRRRHVVLPVKMSCDEARAAIRNATEARDGLLLF